MLWTHLALKRSFAIFSLGLAATAASASAAPFNPRECLEETRAGLKQLSSDASRPVFSAIRTAPAPELRGSTVVTAQSIIENRVKTERFHPSTSVGIGVFLNQSGPLGYDGVLGYASAANQLGPVGTNAWNPSGLISGSLWRDLSKKLTQAGGPLSKDGPMGPHGPDSAEALATLAKMEPYGVHFRQGGVFSVIKQVLGKDSSLGPVGPIGGHGFKRNPVTGNYENGSIVVRKVEIVNPQGKQVEEDLVELYDESQAMANSAKSELDASFVADGVARKGEVDTYEVHVQGGNLVSFLASPATRNDAFSVRVLTQDGQLVAESNSKGIVNFAQITFPQNVTLKVEVRGEGKSIHAPVFGGDALTTGKYRLHVIDSPLEVEPIGFDAAYITQFE